MYFSPSVYLCPLNSGHEKMSTDQLLTEQRAERVFATGLERGDLSGLDKEMTVIVYNNKIGDN